MALNTSPAGLANSSASSEATMHLSGNDIAEYPIPYAIDWRDGCPVIRLREAVERTTKPKRPGAEAWISAVIDGPLSREPNVSAVARSLAATVGGRSVDRYRKVIGDKLTFDGEAGRWMVN